MEISAELMVLFFGIILAIVKLLDFVTKFALKKLGDKPENKITKTDVYKVELEHALDNIRSCMDYMKKCTFDTKQLTEKIFELHSGKDEDNVPLHYVPRSWRTLLENILQIQKDSAYVQSKIIELLTRIGEKVDDRANAKRTNKSTE